MKKNLLFICILFTSLELKAQSYDYYDEDDRPKFFLGIGTGINTYTGLLGVSGNYRIDEKLYIQGGLGLSTWGFRRSIGLRYDLSLRNGFTFALNIANSSGINDIDFTIDSGTGSPRTVNMTLNSASSINIKTGYNWWIGKKSIFHLAFGYAIPLKNQPWTVNDGSTLSATDQQVFELLAPGGIILGLGFSFGF